MSDFREQHERIIRNLCEKRRLAIERHGQTGYRIRGYGVDVIVASLADVNPSDLERHRPHRHP